MKRIQLRESELINLIQRVIKEKQPIKEQQCQHHVLASVQTLSYPQHSQRFTCPSGYHFGPQGNTNTTPTSTSNTVFGGQQGPGGVVAIYTPMCYNPDCGPSVSPEGQDLGIEAPNSDREDVGIEDVGIEDVKEINESHLKRLTHRVINEHTEFGGPNHDPNTHYHGYNCNSQGCAEVASQTDPNVGQYSTQSECEAACTGTCNKDCNQLVPSSFAGLIANKPCNWLNSRINTFTNKLGTLQQQSCQWKRVYCKRKMAYILYSQNGC